MPAISESKYLVSAGWQDVPHIPEAVAKKMLAETPPHLREARSKGIPSLGQGAIYPIAESEFVIPPMRVPPHWFRGYGMDVGWNRTAGAFLALDRDMDVLYLVSEHYRGQAEPSVHASSIKARAATGTGAMQRVWMPGFIDPAARGRSQEDGKQLLQSYQDLGLLLNIADNGREAGILDVYERLSTGRFKVFATCINFLAEYRIYRRDKFGQIVKKNDHMMDAVRYGSRKSALAQFVVPPRDIVIGVPTPNLYNR